MRYGVGLLEQSAALCHAHVDICPRDLVVDTVLLKVVCVLVNIVLSLVVLISAGRTALPALNSVRFLDTPIVRLRGNIEDNPSLL